MPRLCIYCLFKACTDSQGKTVPPHLMLLRMNAKLSRHVGGLRDMRNVSFPRDEGEPRIEGTWE